MIRRTEHCPADYETYLKRQAQKAQLPNVQEKMRARREERVAWFYDRFQGLAPGRAVCLGARYGEEVEALQMRGWEAHGIDLADYAPWVQQGDMNAPIAGRYDLIYTNAFDHCWEPMTFLRNIRDSLKPGGLAMLHFSDGKPGAHETIEWDDLDHLIEFIESAGLKPQRVSFFLPFFGLTTEFVGHA